MKFVIKLKLKISDHPRPNQNSANIQDLPNLTRLATSAELEMTANYQVRESRRFYACLVN